MAIRKLTLEGRLTLPGRFTRQNVNPPPRITLARRLGNPPTRVTLAALKHDEEKILEMGECQGNPLARVTLSPYKQVLKMVITQKIKKGFNGQQIS